MRLLRPYLRRVVAGALLLPALAACTVVTGPDDDLYEDERRLDRAWRRWDAVAIWDYDYVLRRQCYCGFEVTEPVRISVRGGRVVARYYVSSGFSVSPSFYHLFPTVDGLFAEIADAIDTRADRLVADYDDAWGFPRVAEIDYRWNTADDEMAFSAYGFVAR